jgi:hypothetical protein
VVHWRFFYNGLGLKENLVGSLSRHRSEDIEGVKSVGGIKAWWLGQTCFLWATTRMVENPVVGRVDHGRDPSNRIGGRGEHDRRVRWYRVAYRWL